MLARGRQSGLLVLGDALWILAAVPLAALIRLGRSYRLAWRRAVPSNRRVNELLIADKQLLKGQCVPYGDLGDPDISPHWPPVKTTHQ